MFEFLSIFFPSFLSLQIVKNREKINIKDLLLMYPVYCVVNNIIAFSLLIIIKNKIWIDSFTNFSFTLKFMILASFISIITPFIKEIFSHNFIFKIHIKDLKNEKNHK